MPAKTSNFGLIDRAKEGDQEAFSLLFEKHRRRLAVLIHYKFGPEMRDGVEVDDVLQETFLKAFRDIGSFTYRAPGSFMRWLSRIADHTVTDLARYRARQRRGPGEYVRLRSESNPKGPEPADSRTPSRVLTESEAVLALMKRLDALPEDYRQAILLAKVEGLSTAEMAERLGKSREAVALLLHRAIQRFRTITEVGE
jgi:RNA polymerase sigma-70 factor (subfamily 1)